MKKYDFKGPLFKPRKNVQDPSNCPAGDAIYFRQFDPASPPPVLADQDTSSAATSCTRDAYGKCVPAGCASYFDGCNTCNVGTVLGCTMMFCETPQEPKCLEFSSSSTSKKRSGTNYNPPRSYSKEDPDYNGDYYTPEYIGETEKN